MKKRHPSGPSFRGEKLKATSVFGIIKRGVISGAIFTLLWSGWAFYINFEHGSLKATNAAIAQGSFTIINAFLYTVIMESLYEVSKTKLTRFINAFIVPNTIMTTILYFVHSLNETPNILGTIVPSLTVVYLISFSWVVYIAPRRQ
jgi:hypothetical protein